jgi:hypothetical protein
MNAPQEGKKTSFNSMNYILMEAKTIKKGDDRV